MNILFILLAILLLGLLVTVHEWGHFISARLVKIPVKEFSVGFGPTLISWKGKKHDTLFKLSAIPMGGYCMYYGETASDPDSKHNDTEVLEADDPKLYMNHSVWKRMFTVIAGPFMNFVLAFVVAILLVSIYGAKVEGIKIGDIAPNSPAQVAGLMSGDEVLEVNGQSIHDGTQNGLSNAINALAEKDEPLTLTVLRNGEKIDLSVVPQYLEQEKRFIIGTTVMPILGKIQFGEIIPQAYNYCKQASTAIIDALKKLFSTGEGFDQTSGPVGVVKVISEQTKIGGFSVFLHLAIIISINLGLVNLLPIPGLDGARFLFMLVEAIRRKPLNQKIETYIHLTGYVFLFGLLIFLTFRDIINLFK